MKHAIALEHVTADRKPPEDVDAPDTGNPLFRRLNPETRAALLSTGQPARFAKGASVLHAGEPGDSLFILRKGLVEISVIDAGGRKITLNVLRAPDILGEIALLDGGPRTASATALSDVEALRLSRQHLLVHMARDPGVACALAGLVAERLRWVSGQLHDRASLSVPERAARRLLYLEQRMEGAGRSVCVSQETLAEHLATSREHINRILTGWRRGGLVETARGSIRVCDPAGMRVLAGYGDGAVDDK